MATYTTNISVDFSAAGSFFYAGPSSVLQATSSLLQLITPEGGYQNYTGYFAYTYSGGYQYLSWPGSTLQSLTSYSSGWTQQASVSGLNISGSAYKSYADNNDYEGLKIYALRGHDSITGSTYNDVLCGYAGNDTITGGSGIDTAIFSGFASQYQIASSGTAFSISGPDGVDTLLGVERLQFDDKAIACDIDGYAGQAYRLYNAAFDRTPDVIGLGYWINRMDNGMSLTDVANSFISSQEFANLYGANPTDESFVSKLYNNVLDRLPDSGGQAYWLNRLQTDSQSAVLLGFSESAENQNNVIGLISSGIEYWA